MDESWSGLASSVSSVPAGSAAKAALVGANTVNGPGLESVSTSPAVWTAVARVEKVSGIDTAISTMFWATGAAVVSAAGVSTVLMTWITPFDAITSAWATVATTEPSLFTIWTPCAEMETVRVAPLTVVITWPSDSMSEVTAPATTW